MSHRTMKSTWSLHPRVYDALQIAWLHNVSFSTVHHNGVTKKDSNNRAHKIAHILPG